MAGWTKINAAVLIVNEDMATMFELQRGVARRMRDPRRGGADPERMFNDELGERARHMLEIDGGKNLGFDPQAVQRFVRDTLQRQAEEAGSVTRLAADLKRDDITSFDRKEEVNDYVNRMLWEQSVTGKAASPGGRVSRDRYVRPGWAMFAQRVAVRRQSENRTVQVTQLVLTLGAPGSAERAKRRLEELRLRILNGEDMGELAEQLGASEKGTRGLSSFLNVELLRANNPPVGDFLAKAEAGELSEVLEYYDRGRLAGYILVRPEEYKLAPVEAFDEPRGQRVWIEGQRQRVSDRRIQTGLVDLLSGAYVWPPQIFGDPTSKR